MSISAFIRLDEELLIAVPGVIHGEQQVRGKAKPQRTSAGGMVLASDMRLICYSRSAFGSTNFEGFVYSSITSAQFRGGFMGFGTLDITIGVAKKEITAVKNELGTEIINVIQEKVNEIPASPNPAALEAQANIPNEIRQLADLYKDGILTQQEFEEKKQALLRKIT